METWKCALYIEVNMFYSLMGKMSLPFIDSDLLHKGAHLAGLIVLVSMTTDMKINKCWLCLPLLQVTNKLSYLWTCLCTVHDSVTSVDREFIFHHRKSFIRIVISRVNHPSELNYIKLLRHALYKCILENC